MRQIPTLPESESPDVITGTLPAWQKQANAGTTSSMKLTIVTAKGGSRIVGLPAWLKADKTEGHSTEAIDYTHADQNAKDFPTGSFPANAAATFEIQNLSDAAKKVTVTVNVTEAP